MNWLAVKCRGKPPAPDEGGFTLVEVVLALTIFALMGVVLYGAFSLSHSAVEKSETKFIASQKLRSTADLLGTYLRSAFPYRESLQDPAIFFEGEPDSLEFISSYSHAMGGRGLAKISIETDAADGSANLRLSETAPVRLGGESGPSHGLVIQEKLRDFKIAYLDPESDPENWQERWAGRERNALPRAVRLTFHDSDGKEVRWIFPIMMVVLAK
jgi:prepilin-type N-terminal cleavage/methylation domain-containing protein